jgi:hypothetical protein
MEAMASTGKKQSAVLCDDDVKEYLEANLKKVYQIWNLIAGMNWMIVPFLMLWWMMTVMKIILFKTLYGRR